MLISCMSVTSDPCLCIYRQVSLFSIDWQLSCYDFWHIHTLYQTWRVAEKCLRSTPAWLTCLSPGWGTGTSEQSLSTDGPPNSLTLMALIILLADMSSHTQCTTKRKSNSLTRWTVYIYIKKNYWRTPCPKTKVLYHFCSLSFSERLPVNWRHTVDRSVLQCLFWKKYNHNTFKMSTVL